MKGRLFDPSVRKEIERVLKLDEPEQYEIDIIEAMLTSSRGELFRCKFKDMPKNKQILDEARVMLLVDEDIIKVCKTCGSDEGPLTFKLCPKCFDEDLNEQAKRRPGLLE